MNRHYINSIKLTIEKGLHVDKICSYILSLEPNRNSTWKVKRSEPHLNIELSIIEFSCQFSEWFQHAQPDSIRRHDQLSYSPSLAPLISVKLTEKFLIIKLLINQQLYVVLIVLPHRKYFLLEELYLSMVLVVVVRKSMNQAQYLVEIHPGPSCCFRTKRCYNQKYYFYFNL